MQSVFEKIIAAIQAERDDVIVKDTYSRGKSAGLRKAEIIVNEVAEECGGGWIPCSERLPEEHNSIFTQYKGTDKWNNAMFEKISDEVNVTVVDENGENETTTHAHTVDGKWYCDLLKCNKSYRIIAWQPLPEPYKAESEE